MTREASVYGGVKRLLDSLDECWWFKTVGDPNQKKVVDIVGCLKGRFFAFELKQPGEEPTDAQTAVLDRVRAAGGLAAAITSRQEAEEELRRWLSL